MNGIVVGILVFKMDFVLTALVVIMLISAGSTKFVLQTEKGFFTDFPWNDVHVQWLAHQKLDHFDPTNLSTWKQMYVVNEEWFKNHSGPIFLHIAGEGPLPVTCVSSGETAMMEYARHYGALAFGLEHRFYGQSRPKPDLQVENLRYLSSEQALADIAYFISNMNTKYKLTPENKWVVFGGSYAGSLAAWARMKYPHLIHAAVSSSGPVLAKASVEFGEFAQHVFPLSSRKCADNVHQAALKVANLLNQTSGSEILTKKFNLCKPLDTNNPDDVYIFVESMLDSMWGTLQLLGKGGLDDVCECMTGGSGDLLERYAVVTGFPPGQCNYLGNFKQSLLWFQNISYVPAIGGRPWFYQTCTEFGFFFTASSIQGFFGADLNLQLYLDKCKALFGEQFNKKLLIEGIERTNMMYGGMDIDVSRVVFVQGSMDPWSALGIKNSKPDAPAIVIKDAGHHWNMSPSSSDDSKELKNAREQISTLIGTWLSDK